MGLKVAAVLNIEGWGFTFYFVNKFHEKIKSQCVDPKSKYVSFAI